MTGLIAEMSTQPAPKICDLIAAKRNEPWIAFEYFPPKTEQGVENLKKRLARMAEFNPLYVDFTWGAGGSTSDLTLELSQKAQEDNKLVSNMHLTCTNMPKDKLDNALKVSQQVGIRNILALRGDPPVGQKDFEPVDSGFSCALDLVKYIRQETGDVFCVTVAGYPEGHPNRIKKVDNPELLSETERSRAVTMEDGSLHVCSDKDFKEELDYLKEKVDAGANAVVSQMFYDVQCFINFKNACKAHGINVPIIPGIMCITNYNGYKRMVGFCKTRVPEAIKAKLEEIKDDKAAVEEFGIHYGTETCKTLLANGVNGLHFYTLNLDKVVGGILENLKL